MIQNGVSDSRHKYNPDFTNEMFKITAIKINVQNKRYPLLDYLGNCLPYHIFQFY